MVIVTVDTEGSTTNTVADPVLAPAAAMIVVVPLEMAVTTPPAVTVATAGFVDDHVSTIPNITESS